MDIHDDKRAFAAGKGTETLPKIGGTVYAEGEKAKRVEFPSQEAREWYEKGLSDGAGLYGAGSCLLVPDGESPADYL